MIALVDIDNILNNFSACCINSYNHDHGTHFTDSMVTTYDIATSLEICPTYFLENYLLSSIVVENCLPNRDAQIYLEKINQLLTLYIVTARVWCQLTHINKWFSKNYPYIQDRQIIRCVDKRMVRGDVLIDDSLDNILNFPNGRILFDYPYNRDVEDITHFINRVSSWEECYNILKLMNKK